MISVENALLSDQIKNVFFCCDLAQCKGACCIEGDAGAPLTDEEISLLENSIDSIKPFMSPAGQEEIEKTGVFEYDHDGNFVTPLVNHRECAFVVVENEIAFCAIEKSYLAGVQGFRKPISCHLYPIRITSYDDFDAVNYHEWHICRAALNKGKNLKLPLHVFAKDALVRKYGETWYKNMQLRIAKNTLF